MADTQEDFLCSRIHILVSIIYKQTYLSFVFIFGINHAFLVPQERQLANSIFKLLFEGNIVVWPGGSIPLLDTKIPEII
jgi:hypothetical protein